MALIPYADEDPRDERVEALLARLPEPRINLFRMLANAPALIGPTLRLGEAILTKAELDPKLRELVILRVARVTGSEYEWVQHERIARLVGLKDDEIAGVQGDQRAALRLVDAVLGGATPPAELVAEVDRELGRAQLLEVLLTAGYYAMLGGMMRAVRLDVDDVLEKGMLDSERLGGREP
ncbi:MAG TPA: carboxymuconolactone decarboxylase family protein [Solirubrobacteraceae bacterium]|nr:carboxymuconolactone decarboxylase family protein [Solirubrobacteraceae bacterium]